MQSNILFICGGTFFALEEIIAKPMGRKLIGFGHAPTTTDDRELARGTSSSHWVTLAGPGILRNDPELIGRLPVLGTLDELAVADLASILTEPKDALIKQYQTLFRYDDAKLARTDPAIHEIARMAKARGAPTRRALQSILENLMLDIMYDLPDRPAAGQGLP